MRLPRACWAGKGRDSPRPRPPTPSPSRPSIPRAARDAASRKAVGVSVITERLCQTRTGSHAVTRAANRLRGDERPEPGRKARQPDGARPQAEVQYAIPQVKLPPAIAIEGARSIG